MKSIFIKNMVCDRCKNVLQQEFRHAEIPVKTVKLDEIVFDETQTKNYKILQEIVTRNGFEIINSESTILVEQVKSYLINELSKNSKSNSKHINKEYSTISKLFSNSQDITIEKYYILLKIEKAKELVQMGNLSFSDIAYSLDYKSGSHLAKQFKSITGMSMSDYKKNTIMGSTISGQNYINTNQYCKNKNVRNTLVL
ncbi:helix-turn-helix domain-containing protein [Aquimarina muelleri]|uniref:helix-turn-helix domain-containing protein n=1 Tax=Aquimarina muelleri TaxID=279356 RepID=UPI001E3EBCB2|nr:helix-turn-helix domain-containing protein [Aquimarina muelleri]